MAATQFELKPVKDALIPQYPGMPYEPSDGGEGQTPRTRRVSPCLSLLCIFLLSFGLMLSMASCNKDDDGSGGIDGDMEDAEDETGAACTGEDDNACIDNETAGMCIDGRLEEVNCAEYCEETAAGEFYGPYSDGCRSSNGWDNLCGCYDATLGMDGECVPEDSYCLSDEVLNSCSESEWEWEEINCFDFCLNLGKSSAGCVTPEGDRSYCECVTEDCSTSETYCIDHRAVAECVEGKLEILSCETECAEKGMDSNGCLISPEGEAYCDCYSSCEGDCEECYIDDYYCADSDTLVECYEETSCSAYCENNGQISLGCVAPDGEYPYCDCVEADGDEENEEAEEAEEAEDQEEQ